MGKRGPAGRPSYLKALEGTQESRINRQEPLPGAADIVPPVPLPDDAQAVWDRLAPDLIDKGVLQAWDVDMFASFCRSVALYNRAAAEVESAPTITKGSQGQKVISPAIRAMQIAADMMRATGQRFGLTPGDRAALKVEQGQPAKLGPGRLIT